jgi:hypothetical protein
MDEARVDNASRAVVPVRAIKALVSDAVDVFVTSIADSRVACIASGLKKSACKRVKDSIVNCRCKCMLGVVTMLKRNVARNTEIKVITCCASHEILLWELCMEVSIK